ncbi:MAG: acyl-CoA/acyl-ACP dehydrogenase [Bdellovibrionaceae bacterium]|nr:acyl-CoA/acyl-ACP dehydrogenase [Pseudobdellovibrionaceae bacterium]
MNHNELNQIIETVVAKNAEKIDRESFYPKSALDALGKAGILGLISAKEMGGQGFGLREASQVVENLAKVCPSTAMVTMMHFCGTVVIEKYGAKELRKKIATGNHVTTLAWSENGSRSHFWAPIGTAKKNDNKILINSQKSWVTSACEADSYVWSTQPLSAEGASTLWLVTNDSVGLQQPFKFDGLGLRGNASSPLKAENIKVDESSMLGNDGAGFDIMIGDVLPVFSTLISSGSIGLMEGAISRAIKHVSSTQHEHIKTSLAELPTIRAYLAKATIKKDMARTLRDDTIQAIESGREDAVLRVLEVKAATAEIALEVTDTAMRVCGGAAFRKDLGIERYFRDSRAAFVMAPTSDVLYDFIGKAVCGLPVFG